MHKILYGLAVIAAVIGFANISNSYPGSRAYVEAGFLFMSVPIFLIAGFFVGRATMTKCPQCAEKVKKAAKKCKHCGSGI